MKYWIMMLCAALTLTFAGDAHAESAKDRPVTKTHVTKLTGKELKQLSKDGEEGNAEAALRLYYYYQFVKEDRTQAVSAPMKTVPARRAGCCAPSARTTNAADALRHSQLQQGKGGACMARSARRGLCVP